MRGFVFVSLLHRFIVALVFQVVDFISSNHHYIVVHAIEMHSGTPIELISHYVIALYNLHINSPKKQQQQHTN